jgi:hypothetical protein
MPGIFKLTHATMPEHIPLALFGHAITSRPHVMTTTLMMRYIAKGTSSSSHSSSQNQRVELVLLHCMDKATAEAEGCQNRNCCFECQYKYNIMNVFSDDRCSLSDHDCQLSRSSSHPQILNPSTSHGWSQHVPPSFHCPLQCTNSPLALLHLDPRHCRPFPPLPRRRWDHRPRNLFLPQ